MPDERQSSPRLLVPSASPSDSYARRLSQSLIVLAIATLGLQYVIETVVRPLARQTDLAIHLDLADLAARGVNVYRMTPGEAEAYREELRAEVIPVEVNYPPSYFAALAPFAAIDRGVARVLWLALQHISLALAIALLLRTAQLPSELVVVALVALLLGANEPLFQTFRYGQITPLLLLLVAAAMRDLAAGRDRRAGLWLGLAAALKVTPALFFFVPLSRRRWGALLGLLAAIFVVAVAMFLTLPDPVSLTRDFLGGQGGRGMTGAGRSSVLNQSLAAFIARLDWVVPGITSTRSVAAIATPLSAAVILLALALALPRACGLREAFGILVPAALIASPVSWEHSRILLLLPAVLAVAAIRERPAPRAAMIMLVLGWAVVAADLPYDHPALRHGLPALLTSIKLFATVVFAVGFVLLSRRTGGASPLSVESGDPPERAAAVSTTSL